MSFEDKTDWRRLLASTEIINEVIEVTRRELEALAEQAAADAPKDTGRFAKGFLESDAVEVQKKGAEVVTTLKNDVPYSPYVRDSRGGIYIETNFFEPAVDVVEQATLDAIDRVIRRGMKP